jgi:hypothetical protein
VGTDTLDGYEAVGVVGFAPGDTLEVAGMVDDTASEALLLTIIRSLRAHPPTHR